jgi:nitrite reductase (NADH) large subunit
MVRQRTRWGWTALLEKLGIHVHVGKKTTRVLGAECVEGIAFAEGPPLECDIVVFASGTTPNTELAVQSGLTVARAIIVDNQLRTDDQNVYAVGECVQYRAQVYGLVAPAWEQPRFSRSILPGGI